MYPPGTAKAFTELDLVTKITYSLSLDIFLLSLLPRYEIIGLAYANCTGIILWNIILTIYAKKKYNYNTTVLG